MAIRPSALYPGQTDTSDATGYPYGRAKNQDIEGDGTGTPLEAAWLSDLWGFLQALLAAGEVTPSNAPDKVGASDYLTALTTATDRRARSNEWSGDNTFTEDVSLTGATDLFGGPGTARYVRATGSRRHIRLLPLEAFRIDGSGLSSYFTTTGQLSFAEASAELALTLDRFLPRESALVSLRAGVRCTAGAGTRMRMSIDRVAHSMTGDGGAPDLQEAVVQTTASKAGDSILTFPPMSISTLRTHSLILRIKTSAGATSGDADYLRWVEYGYSGYFPIVGL